MLRLSVIVPPGFRVTVRVWAVYPIKEKPISRVPGSKPESVKFPSRSVAVDRVVLLTKTEQKGRASPVSASFTFPVSVAVCAKTQTAQIIKEAKRRSFFTGIWRE
jgi:hypothetical protein